MTDENSIFEEGISKYGGAIYCFNCSSLIFTNTTFLNNYATYGGAIYFDFIDEVY